MKTDSNIDVIGWYSEWDQFTEEQLIDQYLKMYYDKSANVTKRIVLGVSYSEKRFGYRFSKFH